MKKRIIATAALALTAGLAQAITNTATMAGFLNDSATWGGATLPAGPTADSNVWASANFQLKPAGTPEDFWGGALRLDPGGSLRPTANSILNLKGDFHMNGGRIDGGNSGFAKIRLPNQVLILDDGHIQSGNQATKDIAIEGTGATTSGSGAIRLTGTANNTSRIDLNIDMTGFSGLFYLENSGILGLSQDIATNQASFGIQIRAGQNNKYMNNSTMALTTLQISGVPIEDGTYTYADFNPLLQNYLGDTTNTITVINPPQVSVSAIESGGNIFSNSTWGGTLPIKGDIQAWLSSTNNLTSTDGANEFFDAQQFVLETDGLFSPGLNSVARFNALVLDGGVLAYNRNLQATVQADALILNSGTIKSGNAPGRPLNINGSGILWGDGKINILGNTTASNYTETGWVNITLKTSGFTGEFDVKNYGTLKLPAIATNDASFSLSVTGTGRYENQFDAAFTTVTLGDTALPIGEYDEAYFIANDLTNFLVQTTGIITVLGKPSETYEAWAIDNGLTNGINAMDYDVEPDGMNNLLEYALDGNPLVDDAATVQPTASIVDETGTDIFEYIYNRRIDYALLDLDYGVLLGTDLIIAPPTNNVGNTYETGTEALDTEFEAVTNQIPTTEAVKFISLEVIQN